ncbi:MAG: hypothetical protein AAFR69_03540, partial [Pseudomonadota bacterium]
KSLHDPPPNKVNHSSIQKQINDSKRSSDALATNPSLFEIDNLQPGSAMARTEKGWEKIVPKNN